MMHGLFTGYALLSMWSFFVEMLDHVLVLCSQVIQMCNGSFAIGLLDALGIEYIDHLLGELHDGGLLFFETQYGLIIKVLMKLGDLIDVGVSLGIRKDLLAWSLCGGFSKKPRRLHLVMDVSS